ncbi:hypothetical protein F3Y22_tig00117012pilonHSYRG00270 [Hibiscus syriacus]|uniref:Uncharacterized protein n=1 Tax=Hibiscus syriacus TaxID=106335 RepID=A0A6A2WEX9_HIBSY|nr:hypothetical protein F3Y22_tig00117012pilonHSYRG00270 [Hibiscus syriacus]
MLRNFWDFVRHVRVVYEDSVQPTPLAVGIHAMSVLEWPGSPLPVETIRSSKKSRNGEVTCSNPTGSEPTAVENEEELLWMMCLVYQWSVDKSGKIDFVDQDIVFQDSNVPIDRSGPYPIVQFSSRVHNAIDHNMRSSVIVRLLGRTIGKFARLAVAVDLTKPLLPCVVLDQIALEEETENTNPNVVSNMKGVMVGPQKLCCTGTAKEPRFKYPIRLGNGDGTGMVRINEPRGKDEKGEISPELSSSAVDFKSKDTELKRVPEQFASKIDREKETEL